MDLKGKAAIITGAGRGIGKALTVGPAGKGGRVVLEARYDQI